MFACCASLTAAARQHCLRMLPLNLAAGSAVFHQRQLPLHLVPLLCARDLMLLHGKLQLRLLRAQGESLVIVRQNPAQPRDTSASYQHQTSLDHHRLVTHGACWICAGLKTAACGATSAWRVGCSACTAHLVRCSSVPVYMPVRLMMRLPSCSVISVVGSPAVEKAHRQVSGLRGEAAGVLVGAGADAHQLCPTWWGPCQTACQHAAGTAEVCCLLRAQHRCPGLALSW